LGRLASLKNLVIQECKAVEEFPPVRGNLCALEKLFFKMSVFEGDIGGIWWIDESQGTLHGAPFRIGQLVCIGGVGFLNLSVFEEDTGRTWWGDKFQET
jgi:hypothetical protein